ncbi:MAG: GIY-YIG nuclease family protein [Bacteroidales bacterium]|nr:GIY-YIG nuclease family protein [Bacteroidales bacterium]
MVRGGYVYIMTNKYNKVLYTGVTSQLRDRVYNHKTNIYPSSFTSRYQLHKLVYFEGFEYIEEAINREKQIKGGSRKNKINLINNLNHQWKDLFDQIPVGE